MPGSLPNPDLWQRRGWTLQAMVMLGWARILVLAVPFRRWRGNLGLAASGGLPAVDDAAAVSASRLAAQVDRAAGRLPFECKCLPRAMALSWMLRRNGIIHQVVIAIRPPQQRKAGDSLHAWVEVDGKIVLGDLPGPWHEIYRA